MDVQLIGAAVNKTWIHAYEGKRSASKRRETRIRDEMLFMFFFLRGAFASFARITQLPSLPNCLYFQVLGNSRTEKKVCFFVLFVAFLMTRSCGSKA